VHTALLDRSLQASEHLALAAWANTSPLKITAQYGPRSIFGSPALLYVPHHVYVPFSVMAEERERRVHNFPISNAATISLSRHCFFIIEQSHRENKLRSGLEMAM
jgi:hypothetical protein